MEGREVFVEMYFSDDVFGIFGTGQFQFGTNVFEMNARVGCINTLQSGFDHTHTQSDPPENEQPKKLQDESSMYNCERYKPLNESQCSILLEQLFTVFHNL